MRTFRSDNNAGLCPEALKAISVANTGHEIAYGDDRVTAQAVAAFREIFGPDVAVYFVATGSAANTLAIASLTQPWQEIICHAHSHLNMDESTGPERIAHCRVVPIRTESSKVTLDDLTEVASHTRGDIHQPQPGVVSVSNTTEFGTVYTPQEMRDLCKAAHEAGCRVHVDGARFANAVAALDCDPRALTVEAGVDVMSFGGTKNGLASGEAVIFFPQGDGRIFESASQAFAFHRKSTGHLLSKHRFVAAPFAATLSTGAWLQHAAHANQMAARLSQGLRDLGFEMRFPTQANAVFVVFPSHVEKSLQERGHAFYPFGEPRWSMCRLMCAFDTEPTDVDAFLRDAQHALAR